MNGEWKERIDIDVEGSQERNVAGSIGKGKRREMESGRKRGIEQAKQKGGRKNHVNHRPTTHFGETMYETPPLNQVMQKLISSNPTPCTCRFLVHPNHAKSIY